MTPGDAGERPTPTNCQHEPPYPRHRTVVTSLRAPGLVVHAASKRCRLEGPHPIRLCREFDHA